MKYKIMNFTAPPHAETRIAEVKERLLAFASKLKERRMHINLGLPYGREISEEELAQSLAEREMSFEDLERMITSSGLRHTEKQRIEKRAEAFRAAVKASMSVISLVEREPAAYSRIITASRGVAAVTVGADLVDAVAAEVHDDMPWMREITTYIMRRGRACAAEGRPFQVGPIIIDGPPGTGKTHFAQRLGEMLGLHTVRIDIASEGVMGLAGVERGWGSARPGHVVETMLAHRVANPLIVIDELGRGREEVETTKGPTSGAHGHLLAMIEPETARSWRCPYYGVEFDLRHASWIMTTNGIQTVPAALLSRCKVFRVPGLSRNDLRHAALVMSRGRLLDDVAKIAAKSVWRAAQSRRMDLRHVARAIERAEEVQGFGEMLH